jgi:hypothetical protein
MSNYNIQVPWSGKDSLNDTDPDKVVSGGDFNTEFSAVKIAVNSKADLAGSASQAFSATTANPGTDTTQVASTAFVKAAITAGAITAAAINAIVYPVGSIYFNATSAENPAHATLLGFGTWAVYAAGKVAVGLDASDADFDNVADTGGSKTQDLDIENLPAHGHPYRVSPSSTGGSGASGGFTTSSSDSTTGPHNGTTSGTIGDQIGAAGGGVAHNNLQPYVVVRMWKRTA